jgi:hypothetical protein
MSLDDTVMLLLLAMGLFFPTSLGGEGSFVLVGIALVGLSALLLYLVWKQGTRPNAILFISMPIVIILTASTFGLEPNRFGYGVFGQFILLALVLALDLRRVRPSRFISAAFLVASVLNVAVGFSIIVGNEWAGQFLSSFYSYSYPELVPNMVSLHKPVLSFATHSLAGFFLYLFFWMNWETFKARRGALDLCVALCHLVLLVAVASFTSIAFCALALIQMALWLYDRSHKLFALAAVCTLAAVPVGIRTLQYQAESLGFTLPELGVTVLNPDLGGPLARYGPRGELWPTFEHLIDHPFSPIGFTVPSYLFVADSAPLEYLLRGSIPLLLLIYFGLYRFLRFNSPSRGYALWLFLVIVAFEAGFSALPYFRTLFLLPFFVVYLRQVRPNVAELT